MVAAVVAVMSVQPTSEKMTLSQPAAKAEPASAKADGGGQKGRIGWSWVAPCGFLLIDESINFKLARFGKHFLQGPARCRSLGWSLSERRRWSKPRLSRSGGPGRLDVTVSQIAKRAGMSSALAHHYFGSKEEMFLAAMRHILTLYGAEVRGALAAGRRAGGAGAGDSARPRSARRTSGARWSGPG